MIQNSRSKIIAHSPTTVYKKNGISWQAKIILYFPSHHFPTPALYNSPLQAQDGHAVLEKEHWLAKECRHWWGSVHTTHMLDSLTYQNGTQTNMIKFPLIEHTDQYLSETLQNSTSSSLYSTYRSGPLHSGSKSQSYHSHRTPATWAKHTLSQ